MHVCEYMTSNPVTVTPQSTALEAAEKMYGGLEPVCIRAERKNFNQVP